MKLLANENFPLKSVLHLRNNGFDIIAIGEENRSIRDETVIEMAVKEQRLILTFDSDYGKLIFRYKYRPESGVIYIRLVKYLPDEPGKLIEALINSKEITFKNALTVLDKNGIRQRKY